MTNHIAKIHKYRYEKADFIVSERLTEARELRGMTQEKAAEKLSVSRINLGLYENGRKETPKELLFGLQKVYGLPKEFYYTIKWQRV